MNAKTLWNDLPKARLAAAFGFLAILAAAALVAAWKYELTWSDIREGVQDAPAWIFLVSLIFLPPFGVPLAIFLFVIGARFGLLYGTLAACAAIAGHHAIAVGVSHTFKSLTARSRKHAGLWQALERKAGGNAAYLLLLWGFAPGLPYTVKLYLPLAMGVSAVPYLKWNTLGHLLGAIVFVGFGDAVFKGAVLPIVIAAIAAIALGVGLKIFRRRIVTEPA